MHCAEAMLAAAYLLVAYGGWIPCGCVQAPEEVTRADWGTAPRRAGLNVVSEYSGPGMANPTT